ncbi:transposase IS4 domain-containing protein [Pochonia chlamydosporia 170]|uniref:Transposase IS4 domain-containing protein n=1 Tax=Pochonia chlamydosporia 170 TaxID=1380566 RepID=A0A179F6D6_METCM|nr:transposase IS4 domain-containing protein [Pochonia chlamydosporia 170]OAQ60891.1 transposase IS4 domain-containing protein [Pochonia chlamydosporia 170]
MVRYTGKSTETVHIPAKPIPIGYKVWVVADSGYFLRWSFHVKGSGPVGYDASLYPELAPTQGIVIDLLSRLPAPPSTSHGYHCFMDNLFSTPELFEFLRYQGTAATGTTRLGRIDSRKMAELKTEDRSKDVVAWGTLYVRKHKTKDVMQFAFKDNALVLAISTRFTGFEPSIWRLRRRPGKTSTSAKTARVPFEGEPTKMLQIPRLIDEYNHHMNGVDSGDQLRAEFEPPRRIQRGGHQALMYMFLLEVAVTNSFLLQREGWPKTSRLRCKDQTAFRLALCKELLLQYGKQVALQNSQASCIPEAIPIQNAGPTSAVQAMDTVLRDCAKLNSERGKIRDKDPNIGKIRKQNSLIREYADEIAGSTFDDAVKKVNLESAHFVCKDMQVRYNESIYWDIIQRRAHDLDPNKLQTPKGPPDGFSVAEKDAATELSTALGLGGSPPSQRKYRRHWKNLANWRKSGVDMILFYRTTQFDEFCLHYSETANMPLDTKVLELEQSYGCHIKQLEERVMKEAQGDMTGSIWLHQPSIMEKIEIPEERWNNVNNPWLSDAEESKYRSSHGAFQALDGKQRGENGENSDQSVFISLIPRPEELVHVCPIVTIHKGDYLGIFSGNIRYSDVFDKKCGVRGPTKNLWLDYSQATGVLNQMKVSAPQGTENVRLEWELIDFSVASKCHQAWRVAVRALRTIEPFEELVRAAGHTEQYLMHQEPANARKGFLSEG